MERNCYQSHQLTTPRNYINDVLKYPRANADWDYLDRSFPIMPTPAGYGLSKIYQDPIMMRLLNDELNKQHCPKYVKGIEIPINSEGEWKCPALKYLNQFYRQETARIIIDFDDPYFCINVIDLGDGWRLHCGGADLEGNRAERGIFGLWWVYQKNATLANRPDGTGITRLRKFIQTLNQMPNNPYNGMVFKPAGYDVLQKYSSFLDVTNYRRDPRATTSALVKMYKRRIKAVKTNQRDEEHGGYYWRTDLYQPVDPLYDRADSRNPKVFQNNEDNLSENFK